MTTYCGGGESHGIARPVPNLIATLADTGEVIGECLCDEGALVQTMLLLPVRVQREYIHNLIDD